MKAALLLMAFALIASAACGIAGVYVLAGFGWALIAGSLACFTFAALLKKGLTGG